MSANLEIKTLPGEDFFEQFKRDMFHNLFSTHKAMFSMGKSSWDPPTDIYETKDAIIIKMEIAGVREEDLDIVLKDNTLVIRGWRAEDDSPDKEHFHLMELHYGSFERAFILPRTIVPGDIRASYDKGFLKLKIPKRTVPTAIQIQIE